MSATGILQIAIWIACGVGGYIGGTYIAESINPDYINYVSNIITFFSNEGGVAFSIGAIVLAIVTIALGFFMYCVLAALIASAISKIEDMSSSQGLFQLPVMIGFMMAYVVPLLGDESLGKLANILPVSAPFCLPANILIGKCTMAEGILSLAVLLVTTLILIIVTGRVYKGKLFNRK